MKILYLTPFSINDTIAQSGTAINIKKALELCGNEVYLIDSLKSNLVEVFIAKILKRLTGKEFDIMRTPFVLKRYVKQINKCKSNLNYDVIFSSTSLLCAYLKDSKPIVFYTDATYGGMMNYYWDEKKWMKCSVKYGMAIEKAAINNCTIAIYASNWAVNTAVKFHQADSNKCVAINRGANVDHSFNDQDIQNYMQNRNICNSEKKNYRMLFVGRDWKRKGGDIALAIVKLLSKKGYKSKLVVIGCDPDLSEEDKMFVENIGFLRKDNNEEKRRLEELFVTSDLYLQPSRQEAQGIAYAEASAFGLPVVAVNTGGVSDIVTEKNGMLFDMNDSLDIYVERIIKLLNNPDEYKKLCISALQFYKETLNWKAVGYRITKLLESVVNSK